MSNTESLTAEDLRNRLYHSLREKGLVDALKSQLRNKLVCELRHVAVEQTFEPDHGQRSLLHKASNSLVVDHLRQCRYDYTLSVFLPECGTPESQLLTTQDMLQLLHISPQSRLYRTLAQESKNENSKGFLWQLLHEVAAVCGNACKESSVQTDNTRGPTALSLEEQFSKVDDYYTSLGDGNHHRSVALEQRLLSCQKQLEERSRTDTQLEIARFKENELARMRLEEQEKSRQEVDRIRREMEVTYRTKCESLAEREQHSIERLQKERDMSEKETYNQRQSLLEEIEAVRQREANTRRANEVEQREKNLWEEKMKTKEQLIKKREDDVRKAEIEYTQKLRDATERFKLEEQARLLERTKNLEYREVRVRESERRLDDELQSIDHVKSELRQKNKICNELEGEFTKLKHELIGSRSEAELLGGRVREMVDYQVVKEDNAIMRRETDNMRMRIADLTRDVMLERQKNEDLLREMTERASKPTPEVYLMQKQVDKIRNEMKQERAVFDHQKQMMDQRYHDEVERSRALLRKYEEQTCQLEDMNRVIRDLRHQLGQTKTALTNEVYRKPKPNRSDSMCDLDGSHIDPTLIREPASPEQLFSSAHGLLDNILSRRDTARPTAVSDDYSYSMDLVEDTKHRLRKLEKEAENLDQHYQNFQYRVTSVHGALDDPPRVASVPSPAGSASVSHHHGNKAVQAPTSLRTKPHPRVDFSETVNDSRDSHPPPHNKRLDTVNTQPQSSTPTRHSTHSAERSPQNISSPASHKLYGDSSLVDNSMSTVQSSPLGHVVGTNRTGLSVRPLSVEDLERRPGSPDVVVLRSSGAESSLTHSTDGHHGDPQPVDRDPRPGTLPPVTLSLDTAWRTKASEDDTSRRQHEEAEQQEAERRRREAEDREYELQQEQRAEERRKQEQAAWEAEQRELARLEGKPRPTQSEAAHEGKMDPDSAQANVDPVMLKYMEMVEKNKQKEKEVAKNALEVWNKGRKDKTPSVSEDISLADEKSSADVSDGDFW